MDAATQTATSAGLMLSHLPAVFQEQPGDLAPFLSAFEAILLGGAERAGNRPGLEELVSGLDTFLDPRRAPIEFLPWLAGWLALRLRTDLEPAKQVELVSRIVPLYRWRGTRQGIEEILALLTDTRPVITEPESVSLEVGRAIVGDTTRLGRERPHYFEVRIELPEPADQAERDRVEALAHDIIDLTKPAHTYYSLRVETAPQPAGRRAPRARKEKP